MKALIYYIYCPGVLFTGVILKTIKLPILGIWHKILYRNDICNYLTVIWTKANLDIVIPRKLIDS